MKKGFTLIELLIVIAIIGILAGVILVSTSNARSKSQLSGTKQTLRSSIISAAQCRLEGGSVTVNGYTNSSTGGGNICSNGIIVNATYPNLARYSCNYVSSNNSSLNANCGGTLVGCSIDTASCI